MMNYLNLLCILYVHLIASVKLFSLGKSLKGRF
uniref:Uncharacterized protein n=1 Tax=Rhizophora mucronata TaxID=61149 RepID=A0A2P2R197_RHIMU